MISIFIQLFSIIPRHKENPKYWVLSSWLQKRSHFHHYRFRMNMVIFGIRFLQKKDDMGCSQPPKIAGNFSQVPSAPKEGYDGFRRHPSFQNAANRIFDYATSHFLSKSFFFFHSLSFLKVSVVRAILKIPFFGILLALPNDLFKFW